MIPVVNKVIIMETNLFLLIVFVIFYQPSLQDCPEETTHRGISVKWRQSPPSSNIESDPLCYRNETLVTRNCSDAEWIPALHNMEACLKVVKYFDLSSCPPGFHKISENNNDYCYQIGAPSAWNYPCFSSGGASVITDLSANEIKSLLESLTTTNMSRYFWLPARRQKLYNPVIWYIPGPNWGRTVQRGNYMPLQANFFKNCLLIDVVKRAITTETCSNIYPSLCFYINDIDYPATCPKGYHAFRFKPDNGTCFGIERTDFGTGLTYNDFLKNKCTKPMGDDTHNTLTRFIFKKIAELNDLPDEVWCWFKTSFKYNDTYSFENDIHNRNTSLITESEFASLEGIINNVGTLGLFNSSRTLSCMACEAEVIYSQTELMFEYNEVENKIYLTVYFPSGLWKYDFNDKGIQCFSDAKGFVRVVDVNDVPFLDVKSDDKNVEKTVYLIDLIAHSSAQYWCEGHTVNFSLIATDKIIVNPNGNEVHVFALVIKYYNVYEVEDAPDVSDLIVGITKLFEAKQVLLMDILEYTVDHMLILLHLHVAVKDDEKDKSLNILETFNSLKQKGELELDKLNCTFVNISSSLYCLPTISMDAIILDWGLTAIGHITAPKQFCLQGNGLPVKRLCQGSYLFGSVWGDVEGSCDTNYEPTSTTTFLYNFVTGKIPNNYTFHFLTDGLGFVLSDVDIIIPADIYYLSMSLQQVSHIAQENETSVDLGNIENIAWVMDRVMVLDCEYLRLSQTLNSTNVILNSVNNIIEIITQKDLNETLSILPKEDTYQLAIKPRFIVQISYPEYNNITGIAISKGTLADIHKFTDMIIQPLYKNTTLDEVLSIENLEVACWVPDNVFNTLKINNNESDNGPLIPEEIHIIASLFYNDAVFQELSVDYHTINSRIVGLTIPGFISNLKYPIPLVFKGLNRTYFDHFCGYWDFQPQSNHIPGIWKDKGCYLVQSINNMTVCECYHLTHFGQLLYNPKVTDKNDYYIDKHHMKALNIITLIGSFLSLVGITGIWVTALVFANWRKKAGTKILLQLSTAIALPLVLLVVFNLNNTIFVKEDGKHTVAKDKKYLCVGLGALLHYSILASFTWMLLTAILQFIRYVRVLGVRRPSRFMIKFSLIGWGIPLIPVIITLILDTNNYVPSTSYNRSICYPRGIYLILGVLLPISVILGVNIILFILVLHAISRGLDEKMKSTDIDLVGAQLRLSVFLFFLLGLTWVFGIFSFSSNLVWSYLFCLTSTLQGFVLFVYFIICDPATRNMWVTLMTPQLRRGSSRSSISSLSTN